MNYEMNNILADAKRAFEDDRFRDRANDLIGVLCHTPKNERSQVVNAELGDLSQLTRRPLTIVAAALALDLANDLKELAMHL